MVAATGGVVALLHVLLFELSRSRTQTDLDAALAELDTQGQTPATLVESTSDAILLLDADYRGRQRLGGLVQAVIATSERLPGRHLVRARLQHRWPHGARTTQGSRPHWGAGDVVHGRLTAAIDCHRAISNDRAASARADGNPRIARAGQLHPDCHGETACPEGARS
jgi:hypothetical protein